MGTHPIFESDFDCLTDLKMHRLITRHIFKRNYRAQTATDTTLNRNREVKRRHELDDVGDNTVQSMRNVGFENQRAPTFMALQYFDAVYKERFGEQKWAAIRCALLGQAKKAALVTDENEGLIEVMEQIGARDVLERFRQRGAIILEREAEQLEALRVKLGINDTQQTEDITDVTDQQIFGQYVRLELAIEQLESALAFCANLKCYMTPPDTFNLLPNPINADFVPIPLDDLFVALCQAPELGNIEHYYFNFYSQVHHILAHSSRGPYRIVTPSLAENDSIRESLLDALPQTPLVTFHRHTERDEADPGSVYSVLVDVASFNDRHSVTQNTRDNLFYSSNDDVRRELPEEQATQLERALRVCSVEGSVTYTTQTMNHLQNEFLVQSTVKRMLDREKLLVRSAPLDLIGEAFVDVECYGDSRLGQLLLPGLGANFGPRYICKLIVKGRD